MEISNTSEILILDFDHTLFLSNSTEEYLNFAYPRTISVFCLTFIDWFRPWNFLPGVNKRFIYRDFIRVLIISILFPWTYLVYLTRTKKISHAYENLEIINIVKTRHWEKIVLASNGFEFIINPLLKQMNVDFDIVIVSTFFPNKNNVRKVGKKKRLLNLLSSNELEKSTIITDNKEDEVMVDIVNELRLHRWPKEKRSKAGQGLYIPFLYTHASKRGNKNHVLNVMISQDFCIILLAYYLTSSFEIQILLSLFLLLLSFWCIYEVGYFENDLHELKYEKYHNNLDKLNYIEKVKDSNLELSAWIWAISFSIFGIFFLQNSLCLNASCLFHIMIDLLKWGSWLIVLRGLYRIYNYSQFNIRQLVFPLLQIMRLAGPILFLSTNFLGLFLIVSQMTSRWLGYLIYRGGGDEKLVQKRIIRHVIFLVLVIGLAVVQRDFYILISWQFVLILSWSLIQAHLNNLIKLQN